MLDKYSKEKLGRLVTPQQRTKVTAVRFTEDEALRYQMLAKEAYGTTLSDLIRSCLSTLADGLC